MYFRKLIIAVFFLLILLLFLYRAFNLGVQQSDFLKDKSEDIAFRYETVPVSRGTIYGNSQAHPLAVSVSVYSIWCNPKIFLPTQIELETLCQYLYCDPLSLREKLNNYSNKSFLYIKRRVSSEVKSQIESLSLKGLFFLNEYKRYYPESEVTAHMIGLVDIDGHGLEGLELSYNEYLSGESGVKKVLKDRYGKKVKDLEYISSPKQGEDVYLTIDLKLQHIAFHSLKTAVRKHRALSGSVIGVEVHSGKILFLANYPSYNPNNLSFLNYEVMRNRVVQSLYEPGSTVKPFIALGAFELGVLQRDEQIDTSPGHLMIGSKKISDPRNYGKLSIDQLLAKSSQVGISKIAQRLDTQEIYDIFHRIGFFSKVNIGLPGELSMHRPFESYIDPLSHTILSYGYGIKVSPLQLIKAYYILANNGVDRPLYLIEGQRLTIPKPVFSKKKSIMMKEMLVNVVSSKGTGYKALVSGHDVSGKTGTVRKIGEKGYDDSKHIAFFVGMLPANDPDIVVLVLIDEPLTKSFGGGEVAAPVFSDISSQIIHFF